MSAATIDNTRASQYRVIQQPASSENMEYTHKSWITGGKSTEEQYQSSSSTNTPASCFLELFTQCCGCLCLCCDDDSDSDNCNCCCCCDD
jgi:hypothetical protein